ncbi:MAG: GGDEF domain-containing protein [Candidatus Omnitrophica bacterium]|nr:GGDEF domain-containing protein [Candidatus Omnitrophota bacterium]
MFSFLILLMIVFVGVMFYLVKIVVFQLEQRADEDILKSKETFQNIINQKDKAYTEKARLEKEATQIFTLYEMTKNISSHLNEKEAFEVFHQKLKENIVVEDCQLVVDLGDEESLKEKMAPNGYAIFVLRSKEENLGYLLYKGVSGKDNDKFNILAHQFALALKRIKLYKDLERLSVTDGLTNVYTRRYFMERFEEEIKRAAAKKIKLSFLMLDVDHFKMVNDQYGHLTGDYVLKEVGLIIKESIREIDIAGRFGGEEFCVVLPETDAEGALLVAERIRKVTEQRLIKAYDNSIHITLSIGVSMYPADGKQAEELIDKADWSLYRAKSQGRNCVVAFGQYNS